MSALDQLNDKWEAASDRFNLLTDIAPASERTINANIAAWQDYYWGDSPSANALLDWERKYIQTITLLDAAAARTTIAKSVKHTSYYEPPKKSIRLPPLLITATPPPRPAATYHKPSPYPAYAPAPMPAQAPRPYVPIHLDPVDTSSWTDSFSAPAPLTIHDRTPGTAPWVLPQLRSAQRGPGGKGLLAVVGGVLAAWWAKKEGVI